MQVCSYRRRMRKLFEKGCYDVGKLSQVINIPFDVVRQWRWLDFPDPDPNKAGAGELVNSKRLINGIPLTDAQRWVFERRRKELVIELQRLKAFKENYRYGMSLYDIAQKIDVSIVKVKKWRRKYFPFVEPIRFRKFIELVNQEHNPHKIHIALECSRSNIINYRSRCHRELSISTDYWEEYEFFGRKVRKCRDSPN